MRAHKLVLSVALVAVALFTTSSLRSNGFAGAIGGTVTNGVTPLVGVLVQVHDSTGAFVLSNTTGPGGTYSVAGLAAGTYFVRTFNSLGYVDELFDSFECVSCSPSVASGTPVTVTDGLTTTINFALEQGGGISGSVAVAGVPTSGVFVTIVDPGNAFVTSATTIAGGTFATTTGLPAGTYFARTSASSAAINEVWNNVPCAQSCLLTSATPITVTAGLVTPGITFDLEQGTRFTGTVTDSALVGVAGVFIEVRNAANQTLASATTDAGGNYTTSPGIAAGDYFLRTTNTSGLINELNDGLPCIGFCEVAGRTPVSTPAGVITGPVDFVLDAGSRIAGTVVDTTANPIVGATVQILTNTGSQVTFAFTTAGGAYITRDGLPAGTYYATTSNNLGFINQLHSGISCVPSCSVALGTAINVPAVTTVNGINFSLAPGARIVGRVSGAGGVSLSNVSVQVINAAGTTLSTGLTAANGSYATASGLPSGTYYLRTVNGRGLINEVYPDHLCQGTLCPSPAGLGTAIVLTAGSPPVTIDMDLAEGGRISGTLLDSGTSAPLIGATVSILSLTGQSLGTSSTDALGNYISGNGLTTASFYVRTTNSIGYIDELFDNVVCGLSCALTAGSQVGVTTGSETQNVDFALALGGTISGQVTSGVTPLGNVSVQIVNATTNQTITDATDASGNFSVRGLADGTYYARTSNTQGYINEVFDNLQCPLSCFNILGAPLDIAGANTVSGVNFDLEIGARISGVVTDNATSLPIAGATVSILDPSGFTASSGTTDLNGQYISGAGLPTGNYYVRTNNSLGYINELFDGISCATGCTLGTGTLVSATAGGTTFGINFGLSAGGRVSGQVTDSGTGNPISGIGIQLYDAAGRQIGFANTDAAGNFITGAGLTTGQYYARTSNSLGYLDGLFNNKPCVGACSVLTGDSFSVTTGSTTPGINFSLSTGGRISGTITDAGTGLPINGASVAVHDSTGRFVSGGSTNTFGVYTTGQGLATGTYYVRTNNGLGYINELFGGLPCVGNCVVTAGSPVSVTSPATTNSVNFQLSPGGRITGMVTEAGGGPLPGVSVLIFNAAGVNVSSGGTNALGIYRTTAGLPTGTYKVRTFNGQGLINQLHSGLECLGQCDLISSGTGVNVTTGLETTDIDFTLTRGARISGAITRAGSGDPIAGVFVSVFNASNVRVAGALSDGSGNFVTSEGLPAATYYARTENSLGLVNQVFSGIDCAAVCNPPAGTGIPVAGTGIIGATNFVLSPDADGDADGIVNTIDPQPAVFSNDFTDVAQGGTSAGTISNRAAWTIQVGDVSPGGIQIDLTGGSGTPATFDVCALNGLQRIVLDANGESVVYNCDATTGSTTVRAINALPIVELRDPATGPGVIIQLATGQGATTGSPVTALATNTDAIKIIIVDAAGTPIGSFELDAGESAEVVVNPNGSVDAEVIEGVVEVTVRGESTVLESGETHDFPPPAGPGYTFTGFFAPLSNPPAINNEDAGNIIAVRFGLGGYKGLNVLDPGFPKSQPMSCTTWTPLGPAVSTNSLLGIGLQFVLGQYIYPWRTEPSWLGTCRQLQVKLNDGSMHVANVKFRGLVFTGFFSPVANPPVLNSEWAGSFVELPFSLGGFFGLDVFAAGFPKSQQINCTTKAPIGAAQAIGSPSGLLFNPFNGRYIYVWKTQLSWKNTCREFQATFTDGTAKTAQFKLK